MKINKNKIFNFILWSIILSPFIALILLGVVLFSTGFNRGYSEGQRVGTITKFSKKGLFFKTWEGEMLMGGMNTNSKGQSVPNTFQFSVLDENLVNEIILSMERGDTVSLYYIQWSIPHIKKMGTGYEIIKIKNKGK